MVMPLELREVQDMLTAEPTCVLLCREIFILICLVSVGSDATGAMLFKSNWVGAPCQAGMPGWKVASLIPVCLSSALGCWAARSLPRSSSSQQTCPVSLPSHRPAAKQWALQSSTSTGKQASSWFKNFLF